MSLKCAELGWNRKTGKCVEKCFTKIPKSCKDCEEIGIDCINKAELKKVCKKFKFSPKKGCLDDGPKCPEKKPESCKDCEKMGSICIKQGGKAVAKFCKKQGWDSKKGCKDITGPKEKTIDYE